MSGVISGELQRSEEEALRAGAELWIVPDLNESSWTPKIDWYLNFQILRSAQHRTPQTSPEFKAVIEDWEFERPKFELRSPAPLMIATSELLPNHSVVLVPVAQAPLATWAMSVHEVWSKLDKPSIRIFLPENFAAPEFAKVWPQEDRSALSRAIVSSSAL